MFLDQPHRVSTAHFGQIIDIQIALFAMANAVSVYFLHVLPCGGTGRRDPNTVEIGESDIFCQRRTSRM